VGGADRADGAGEMLGAAVGQIVAIDRGHDDMTQAQLGDGVGDALGLARFQGIRQASADVAERARARAGLAHDHEGRVLLLPALADVGAARLFADRDELMFAHDVAGHGIGGRARRLDADPVGFSRDRLIRLMRLLGMARARGADVVREKVEHFGHDKSLARRPLTYRRRATQSDVGRVSARARHCRDIEAVGRGDMRAHAQARAQSRSVRGQRRKPSGLRELDGVDRKEIRVRLEEGGNAILVLRLQHRTGDIEDAAARLDERAAVSSVSI